MYLNIELDREDDGRWIAEIVELPGVVAYGTSEAGAISAVQATALRVIADRLEHGEILAPELSLVFGPAA